MTAFWRGAPAIARLAEIFAKDECSPGQTQCRTMDRLAERAAD
jgi:hypothetical protein